MLKYIKWIGVVLFVIIVVVCAIAIYQLNNTTIRQTKDFAVMYVDSEDVVDATVILSPPEKYSQLSEIDVKLRKRVSEYMKKNKLKLKSGKQEFVRNNPTFEELINDGFVFEKIE